MTGGDSGIGRAVAYFFAREGADVAISYLPEEQADAEETRRCIEETGRHCALIPGDLSRLEACVSSPGWCCRSWGIKRRDDTLRR